MAESITAGAVSLDLVIKDTLDKQLDGIKSRIESALSKVSETSANKAAAATDNAAKAAEASVKKAEKAVEQADNGISKAIDECMARYKKQYEQMMDSVSEAAASIKPQTVEIHYNSDYDPSKVDAEVNEITKGIEDKLNGVKKKSKEVFEGFQVPESAVGRLQAQFDIIGKKTEELQNKYKELQMALANTEDGDIAAKIDKEMGDVEAKLISLADRADKTKEKINAALNDDGEPEVAESIKKVERSANKASSSIKNRLGSAFRSAKNISQKALASVKERIKSVGDSANAVTKPIDSLFKRIRNGARRIFVMAGILSVLKSMRSALGEAANSNKQFSDSLESIKFNLAVAFEPIITSVMPMLNTLMSGVNKVTQQIAAFTSALFGKTYKQSAQAVAKSKQAAAAAKKAGKEAKTASKYLADFDEMRVHQDSSDSSSGGGTDETDYSKLADQDVKLSSGLEKLINAIKSGDLGSIGKMIADKINSSVLGIKWDKLREKVRKGAGKLADGINGFTANLKWKKLGESIGNGITTAFTFAYTFLKSTKWKEIGTGFGNLLNGIVEKTDFGLVGKTLGAKFNALIGLVFGFVSTFDFAKAGLGLSDLVNGWLGEVNWEQLGDSLGLSIQGMIDFAFNFITNLNFKDAASNLSTVLNRTINKIDFKKLGQTVSDLFVGVWDFIGTALDEIDWENVGKSIGDFISGIKWGEILTSIFKAIGGVLKAMPSLLKGLVESLDFESAAGLVGVLFAPKIASSLLSKFKSDPNVTSTLGESATTLANKIASGADLSSYSFTEKFAAATTAFFVGWKIGSWLYDTFQEQFDWWGEQLGKVFAKGITEEANKAVERANKAVKETNSVAKKYEKKGYKIDWTNESTIRDSVDKARIAESKKQKSAGWGTSLDSGGGGSTGKQTGSSGFDASQYMPRLASGGVVKAPTLALVGDNSDVKANPEVVAPLSELQKLTGTQDMVKYLQQIIMLLETMQFAFDCEIDGDKLLKAVAKQNRKHKQRTGVSAI